jgi:hypothetical protein
MYPEIRSMVVTITIIPKRITPTRFQSLEVKAKISGVPMPPAPITPRMEAERTLISNR